MSSDSVAQDQLKSFVRRIESVEDEIKVLNGDKADIYKEAKSNGFDVKVLRKVIADRRKDSNERTEFETIYDLYWSALHGVVRAHVENIEEFDAETGEILDDIHHSDGSETSISEGAAEHASGARADDAPQTFHEPEGSKPLPEGEAPVTPHFVTPAEAKTSDEEASADTSGEVQDESAIHLPAHLPAVAEGSRSTRGIDVGDGGEAPRHRTQDEIADDMGLPEGVDPRCQKPGTCGRHSHISLCHNCRVAAGIEPEAEIA